MADGTEVLACFHRIRDALMTCDTGALGELLTEDYRGYDLWGELEGRETVLDAYRPGVTSMEDWDVNDLEVEVFSEVAVLTGKGFVAGTWKGDPWSHHLRFCDVYVKRDGAWRLHLTQATPLADSGSTS
jgi:hypothetical protein